ncbi:Filaggrin [Microtus ochrogaster]|uniref:Filaggrin n=1 Tax=Microtus ochrogaster TaxID=79684 RepID=A0A8J6KQL1_MICOH|nr:Filaggrin [Microtus ochrogaster]
MIDIFQQYSNNDKETETLSKKELKELLEIELRAVLKNPDDEDIADVFMQILDVDHNEKIDFTEYLLLVLKLAQAYYESSRNKSLQTGSKRRRKDHYKQVEDDGEEEEEEERRQRHRRTDGKQNKERSKSPRGRGKERHGSSSRKQERDTNTHGETEKRGKHHSSNRKHRRGSNSVERRDSKGKKNRKTKETNKIKYVVVKYENENYEGTDKYSGDYYYEKGDVQEERENERSSNRQKIEQKESTDRTRQSGHRETARGHASEHEQSTDRSRQPGSRQRSEPSQRQADSPRGTTRTGSRGRQESPAGHQSPDGHRHSTSRRERHHGDRASLDSDSEGSSEVTVGHRHSSVKQWHTRSNSGDHRESSEYDQGGDNSGLSSKRLEFTYSPRYYYYH